MIDNSNNNPVTLPRHCYRIAMNRRRNTVPVKSWVWHIHIYIYILWYDFMRLSWIVRLYRCFSEVSTNSVYKLKSRTWRSVIEQNYVFYFISRFNKKIFFVFLIIPFADTNVVLNVFVLSFRYGPTNSESYEIFKNLIC